MTTALTAADLEAALADTRHQGHGYATSRWAGMDRAEAEKLDAAVIEVANALDLSYEELFHWANSKWARWLVDGVHGCGEPATADTVRMYLDARKVVEVTPR